jgi:uncharacterized protein
MKYKLIFIFVLILLSGFTVTQTFPSPVGYVNDFANVLEQTYEDQITAITKSLEENTTAELVVVTINSTGSLDTKTYAVKLFEEWGIGKHGKDNGILVLLVVGQRRIEIEVGYGLEGILPDGKVGRILDDYAVPYLRQDLYGEGLTNLVKKFEEVIESEYDQSDKTVQENNVISLILFLIPFSITTIIVIYVLVKAVKSSATKCPKCNVKMKRKQQGMYTVYECPRCGYKIKRKRKKAFFFFTPYRHSGGGFGGFGGGRSGGGGAGRGFLKNKTLY